MGAQRRPHHEALCGKSSLTPRSYLKNREQGTSEEERGTQTAARPHDKQVPNPPNDRASSATLTASREAFTVKSNMGYTCLCARTPCTGTDRLTSDMPREETPFTGTGLPGSLPQLPTPSCRHPPWGEPRYVAPPRGLRGPLPPGAGPGHRPPTGTGAAGLMSACQAYERAWRVGGTP